MVKEVLIYKRYNIIKSRNLMNTFIIMNYLAKYFLFTDWERYGFTQMGLT